MSASIGDLTSKIKRLQSAHKSLCERIKAAERELKDARMDLAMVKK